VFDPERNSGTLVLIDMVQ